MEPVEEKGKKGGGPFTCFNDEYLLQCPYNPSHHVTNLRMMSHLMKCRRNFNKAQALVGEEVMMMTCKYNWTHQIPAPEIIFHESNCEDQFKLVAYLVEYQDKLKRKEKKRAQIARRLETEKALAETSADNFYVTSGSDCRKFYAGNKDEDEVQSIGCDDTVSMLSDRPPDLRYPNFPVENALNWGEEEDWGMDARRRGACEPKAKSQNADGQPFRVPPNISKMERKMFRATIAEQNAKRQNPKGEVEDVAQDFGRGEGGLRK